MIDRDAFEEFAGDAEARLARIPEVDRHATEVESPSDWRTSEVRVVVRPDEGKFPDLFADLRSMEGGKWLDLADFRKASKALGNFVYDVLGALETAQNFSDFDDWQDDEEIEVGEDDGAPYMKVRFELE